MKPGRPEKISPARRAQLARDYRAGRTARWLCWTYDLSIRSLYRYLALEGVLLRGKHAKRPTRNRDTPMPLRGRVPLGPTTFGCPGCGDRAASPEGHAQCGGPVAA